MGARAARCGYSPAAQALAGVAQIACVEGDYLRAATVYALRHDLT